MTPREELESFYRNNFDQLVVKLSRQAGSNENSEDVVQEAFYRALRYLDSFNPAMNEFSTWFYSILRKSLIDKKREEMRMGMAVEQEEIDLEEDAGVYLPDPDQGDWMMKEIEKKKLLTHRNILYLYYLRDYKPGEIARLIEETPRQITEVVRRFKQEMVEKYGTPS